MAVPWEEITVVSIAVTNGVGFIAIMSFLYLKRRIDNNEDQSNENKNSIQEILQYLGGSDVSDRDKGNINRLFRKIGGLREAVDDMERKMDSHHQDVYGEVRNLGFRQTQVIEQLDDLDDVGEFNQDDIPDLSSIMEEKE